MSFANAEPAVIGRPGRSRPPGPRGITFLLRLLRARTDGSIS